MYTIPTTIRIFISCTICLLTVSCDKDDDGPSGSSARIVFDSNRDLDDNQGSEIYVTNENGSTQTRLTNNPGFDSDPKWNSNGSKIIFSSHRSGNSSNIYIMNSDGGNQIMITDPAFGGSFPSISPDDTRIVFNSSDAANSSANAGLFIMNADGSNRQRLGINFGDSDPDFSPDGNKIVFSSSRTGDDEIYIMDTNGLNQIRLTNETFTDFMPAWNPAGDKIVFVSFRANKKGIYIMNSDGSNQTLIYESPMSEQPNDPAFNPDGNQIVFSEDNRLNIINIDGTGFTTLPGMGVNGDPDWR